MECLKVLYRAIAIFSLYLTSKNMIYNVPSVKYQIGTDYIKLYA